MELIDNLEYKIDDIAEAIKYKTDIDEDWKIAEMARLIRAINNGNGNPSGIQSVEIADAILSEFTEEINKTIAKKETK